jgi:glucosamine-6-phosphate deaminase
MHCHIAKTSEEMGIAAADKAAEVICNYIEKQGYARIVLSTGASQFTFLKALADKKIDWSKVEMFHLDEYVGLPETHPASFRSYLRERFLSYAPVAKAHLVSGEGDVAAHIAELSKEIGKAAIDLALIGIGENAHIAFNDPPADFEMTDAYKIVDLDDECKAQQVREGWFESLDTVPKQAITMTVQQILNSKTIVSCVPHQVKANAIRNTMQEGLSNLVPATILKTHGDWWLYLDKASASEMEHSKLIK